MGTASVEDILLLERSFTDAIVHNDADAIARMVADDWIIVDADCGIVDRTRFLHVVRSGALTHRAMESEDVRVRLYGDAAVVTALTRTDGTFMGQVFGSVERATDVFVKRGEKWQCVTTHLTRCVEPADGSR